MVACIIKFQQGPVHIFKNCLEKPGLTVLSYSYIQVDANASKIIHVPCLSCGWPRGDMFCT